MYSMIEMMENYITKMEKRLINKPVEDQDGVELVPVAGRVELNDTHDISSSGDLTNFSISRMPVMMICLDSAAAKSGSNCDLVEVVRKLATSGDVIVVEEAWNSVIVVLGLNISPSTGTHALQLVTLARQVIGAVRRE